MAINYRIICAIIPMAQVNDSEAPYALDTLQTGLCHGASTCSLGFCPMKIQQIMAWQTASPCTGKQKEQSLSLYWYSWIYSIGVLSRHLKGLLPQSKYAFFSWLTIVFIDVN
jgi:hypothetical protein